MNALRQLSLLRTKLRESGQVKIIGHWSGFFFGGGGGGGGGGRQ